MREYRAARAGSVESRAARMCAVSADTRMVGVWVPVGIPRVESVKVRRWSVRVPLRAPLRYQSATARRTTASEVRAYSHEYRWYASLGSSSW